MSAPVDSASFRAAMARFPGAVTIVTTGRGQGRRGITATAVCSVTTEPPSLLVCLNRKTGTCSAVAESGCFSVNLWPHDCASLALVFAGASGATGAEKFETGDWSEDGRGLPVLSNAITAFSCDVTDSMVVGSHLIFVGKVVAMARAEGASLIYQQSRFHHLEQA